jgi:hypothetical protein
MSRQDWLFLFAVLGAMASLTKIAESFGADLKRWKANPKGKTKPKGQWFLFCLMILTLVMSAIGWYEYRTIDRTAFENPDVTERIANKTFTNETVDFDGKRFDHCTFVNVTYLYKGTGPIQCNDCTFSGSMKVVLGSDAASGTGFFLKMLGEIKGNIPFRRFDKYGEERSLEGPAAP